MERIIILIDVNVQGDNKVEGHAFSSIQPKPRDIFKKITNEV